MNAEEPNPTPATQDPAAPLRRLFDNPWFTTALLVTLFFLLPDWNTPVVSIGCAGYFTALVALFPERLRSRNGSMSTALWLAGFLWVIASAVSVASFIGAI